MNSSTNDGSKIDKILKMIHKIENNT